MWILTSGICKFEVASGVYEFGGPQDIINLRLQHCLVNPTWKNLYHIFWGLKTWSIYEWNQFKVWGALWAGLPTVSGFCSPGMVWSLFPGCFSCPQWGFLFPPLSIFLKKNDCFPRQEGLTTNRWCQFPGYLDFLTSPTYEYTQWFCSRIIQKNPEIHCIISNKPPQYHRVFDPSLRYYRTPLGEKERKVVVHLLAAWSTWKIWNLSSARSSGQN